MDLLNRFLGSLYGLAVGDAVGTTVEFKSRVSFEPVQDMVGGGVFNLKPGQWTDDTSMALCLAESLIECEGFDLKNQIEKYERWLDVGYLSSTGQCFDIGNTVLMALGDYKKTGNPYSGSSDKYSAGNGSVMRLAPVGLLYSFNLHENLKFCAESSKSTHQNQEAIDGCQLIGALIHGTLKGIEKDELLSVDFIKNIKKEANVEWCDTINEIAYGSYKDKTEDEIKSTGYVVHTLEAALWSFYNTTSFTDGLFKVVNLCDDADTTGAVYGQLAGAYYGVESMPDEWIEKLTYTNKIRNFVQGLFQLRSRLEKQ